MLQGYISHNRLFFSCERIGGVWAQDWIYNESDKTIWGWEIPGASWNYRNSLYCDSDGIYWLLSAQRLLSQLVHQDSYHDLCMFLWDSESAACLCSLGHKLAHEVEHSSPTPQLMGGIRKGRERGEGRETGDWLHLEVENSLSLENPSTLLEPEWLVDIHNHLIGC